MCEAKSEGICFQWRKKWNFRHWLYKWELKFVFSPAVVDIKFKYAYVVKVSKKRINGMSLARSGM